jgi:hypothetical protein
MNSPQRRLFVSALAVALLSSAAAPVLAMSGGASEAGRRLARDLPVEASNLKSLREPAATTQAQLGIALDELRQMSAPADLDPHYLPALVAAGRAFVAVSGQDPLTRTAINPEYTGLESELAAGEARLARSAGDARTVAAGIRRLERRLAHMRRRVRRLGRRLRAAHARARRGP